MNKLFGYIITALACITFGNGSLFGASAAASPCAQAVATPADCELPLADQLTELVLFCHESKRAENLEAARSLLQKKRPDFDTEDVRSLNNYYKLSPRLLRNIGVYCLHAGENERAEAILTYALQLAPKDTKDPIALYFYGKTIESEDKELAHDLFADAYAIIWEKYGRTRTLEAKSDTDRIRNTATSRTYLTIARNYKDAARAGKEKARQQLDY